MCHLHVDRSAVWNQYLLCRLLRTGGFVNMLHAPKSCSKSPYSWIARPVQLHKKLICQNLERVTKDPRPPLESSRKGASKWGGAHFVKLFFSDLFFPISSKINFSKCVHLHLDAPFCGDPRSGLRFLVSTSNCWQIDFV